MRNRGVAVLKVVALVVVILACVGFVAYWMAKDRPGRPTGQAQIAPAPAEYVCAAPGCGFGLTLKGDEAAGLPKGPAFDGRQGQLGKCPKCGKFSLVQATP